ncbi:MAG: hypothetical protein IPK73_18600 [Candidatus Obscuribacter sp.]|nr:hypothetical protein [Candidatus Obscuribacter sp.]
MTKDCIYCKESKDVGLFNREHVIPQSMGRYDQNLVLDCVCKQCNDFFSASLDGILGRDSLEALLRFKYGLKSVSKLGELKGKRLVLKVPPDGGPWAGAQIELIGRDGEIIARPMTQIGFLNKTTGVFEFILFEELQKLGFVEREDLNSNNFRMLGSSDEELEKLRSLLEKAGWNPTIHGELPPPVDDAENVKSIEVEINYLIDRRMKRAIAKIAFNYFAYQVGVNGNAELLNDVSVQAVRSFVRDDSDPAFDPVAITDEPILDLDEKTRRHTDSHLVVLDWLFYRNGRKDLRVSVSLFNHLTYHVTFIPNFQPRPLPDLVVGHQFDFSYSPARCLELLIGAPA